MFPGFQPATVTTISGLVNVGLLGPLRLVGDDGEELSLGPSKQRAVFALLALRARRWLAPNS